MRFIYVQKRGFEISTKIRERCGFPKWLNTAEIFRGCGATDMDPRNTDVTLLPSISSFANSPQFRMDIHPAGVRNNRGGRYLSDLLPYFGVFPRIANPVIFRRRGACPEYAECGGGIASSSTPLPFPEFPDELPAAAIPKTSLVTREFPRIAELPTPYLCVELPEIRSNFFRLRRCSGYPEYIRGFPTHSSIPAEFATFRN